MKLMVATSSDEAQGRLAVNTICEAGRSASRIFIGDAE